ncbi:MAG: DUF2997 domain-containing protein [Desulfobacterales bacterium]|nr:DUF2997 domain-containing protein [Desulfobacterales bacterium]MBF0397786.1 DUF2997 domain-containing protein [Desulfobacterales bacterium]
MEIDVEINENGDVKVQVKGIKGKGCLEYSKIFQELLGPIKEQKLTSEYYDHEVKISDKVYVGYRQ